MYSGKEFANTLIDTSIVVVLAAALARLKADKGAKHTEAKLDFDLRNILNESMFFGLTATMVSALYHWDLQPYIIGTYYPY